MRPVPHAARSRRSDRRLGCRWSAGMANDACPQLAAATVTGSVLVEAGFTVDAISGERFVRLVREHRLGFEPTRIRSGRTVRYSDAALERLVSEEPLVRASVELGD